jgi:hypothetical protein
MSRRSRRRSGAPGLIGLLIAGMALLAVALMIDVALRRPAIAPEPPDDYGTPVSQNSALAQADKQNSLPSVGSHEGCRIARFGLAPWAPPGTTWTPERRLATQAAFMHMGMPDSTAQRAVKAIEHDGPDDVIGMGNRGGIGLGGNTYGPMFHTTFKSAAMGRVTCRYTRTAFASDARTADAAVWIVDGWHVAVFLVCGNVSVLYPGPLLAPKNERVNQVPEPSTIWLMLSGLGFLIWRKR